MNRKVFAGWRDVLQFTRRQTFDGKGFKSATIILALILLLGGMAVSVLMAFIQGKDAEALSPIETVRIVDESDLSVLFLDGFAEMQSQKYPNVVFEKAEGNLEELAADLGSTNPRDLILHLAHGGNGYLMTAMIPEGSEIGKGDAEDFLSDFQLCMEQSKLISSGIEKEKLVYAISGVTSELFAAGEAEKSVGEELVSMLLPMLVILTLYIMTLLYGQSITTVVSIEKASKLMEQMLTLTRPEALILGKVLAIVELAFMQLAIWILCLVAGFIGGDFIAQNVINPGYNNVLLEAFHLVQMQEGSTGFSVGAIALSLCSLCLGFLFYCAIAALIASFVSKTEEIAMCNGYYMMIVLIGFFGSYMLPLQEKEWLNTILRIVPVTSAFLLPGDILVGNVNVWLGLAYTGILLITTLVLVIVGGKVYKAQVFNRGMSVFDRLKNKRARA